MPLKYQIKLNNETYFIEYTSSVKIVTINSDML